MGWRGSLARRKQIPWAAAVIAMATLPAGALMGQDTLETEPLAQQLWTKGCQQVAHGQFRKAATTFDVIRQINPEDEATQQVTDWLAEYEQLQQRREEFRQKRHAARVAQADSHRTRGIAAAAMALLANAATEVWQPDAGTPTAEAETTRSPHALFSVLGCLRSGLQGAAGSEFVDAIDAARQAGYDAHDADAFREGPWLAGIVRLAEAQAGQFRNDGKWLDATAVYWRLEQIFEDEKGYREQSRQCQSHARLEATYKLDAEWEDKLQGIDGQMIIDALDKVEQHYVKKPGFRKITADGLRALLTLVETKSLHDVFESLADEQLVREFTARLGALLNQVETSSTIDRKEAEAYFQRLLEANRQTIGLPEWVVIKEAAEGGLGALDRFTSFIWPAEVEEFRKHTVGEFSGVGIQIGKDEGGLRVVSPLEGTPAYDEGIQPGDLIVKIDGKSAQGMSLNRAVMAITGPPGTQVVLTIHREGVKHEIDVPLTRARIKIHTVKGYKRDEANKWDYMIDSELKIAYVRVASFMDNTVDELKQTLEELQKRDVRGVILDLRVNPGGLLRSAVEMAELFLPKDKLIVKTQGRRPDDTHRTESRAAATLHLPLIVMVNGASASASEIVAGAIKDHGLGLVLGERTYGKGSVQNLLPIADNTAFLKLTTALYLLPSDRSIDRSDDSETWGVEPHIMIKLAPKELGQIGLMRRKADIVKGKGQPASAPPHAESDTAAQEPEAPDVLPETDPQLEAALLVMRVRLLGDQDWWPEAHAQASKSSNELAPLTH